MVMVVVLMVVWYRGAEAGISGGDSTWSYILLEFRTKMAVRQHVRVPHTCQES